MVGFQRSKQFSATVAVALAQVVFINHGLARTPETELSAKAATDSNVSRTIDTDPLEARRFEAFARQIAVQERIRWLSGLPPIWPEAGRLPSLETIYSGEFRGTVQSGSDLFEPWPLVSGDLYAAPFTSPLRQPIGHRITPLPKGGYRYEPIHRETVPRVPVNRPVPPTEELPPPLQLQGLREF